MNSISKSIPPSSAEAAKEEKPMPSLASLQETGVASSSLNALPIANDGILDEAAVVDVEPSTSAQPGISLNNLGSSLPKGDATSCAPACPGSSSVGGGAVQELPRKCPKDFIFGKIIGEGSFSTVYHAKEVGTGREFAIKVCEKRLIKKERKVPYVMREKEVMNILNQNLHPFFIRLYCTFQDDERLYFVLTWAKNGELFDYMRKLGSFDDEVTCFYSAEIVVALEHLHKLGIVHRDLKPENILLSDDMHIRISDFGSAKNLREDEDRPTPLLPQPRKNSFVGTAQYVSPEVLTSKPCTAGCDLWAVGCILYQMLSGLPPFRAPNEYLIFQKISKLDYSFPDGFHAVARNLVESLLILEPAERLGSVEKGGYAQLKAHAFFSGLDWENIVNLKPPDIRPYLPAATAGEEDLHSNYALPDHLEPGLDDKQLTRIMGLELADVKPIAEPKCVFRLSPETRRKRLEEQAKNNPYNRFVEGNIVLKMGLVDKRKGLFARTRMLLLTEGPHLYYVNPENMELKGQIPWSKELRPEAKNFKTFFVHTPLRTYYLIDYTGHAPEWCTAIEEVRQYYYCQEGSDQQ